MQFWMAVTSLPALSVSVCVSSGHCLLVLQTGSLLLAGSLTSGLNFYTLFSVLLALKQQEVLQGIEIVDRKGF